MLDDGKKIADGKGFFNLERGCIKGPRRNCPQRGLLVMNQLPKRLAASSKTSLGTPHQAFRAVSCIMIVPQ